MTDRLRDISATLQRIADALDRLAPEPPVPADPAGGAAFVWSGTALRAIDVPAAMPLDLLHGIDAQKSAVLANSQRHAKRLPAHDILLWGSRGMGKSALVKAVHAELGDPRLALVEVARDDFPTLPLLFRTLRAVDRRFLLFIDDLSFEAGEPEYKALRSLLEGGIDARPDNCRLYVTSNRRHLVPRDIAENEAATAINPRDVIDDRLALADRFGLSLGFHACDQPTYLAIVGAYAARFGLSFDAHDALAWAVTRGSRSGRVAWQYVQEVAGREGRRLDSAR